MLRAISRPTNRIINNASGRGANDELCYHFSLLAYTAACTNPPDLLLEKGDCACIFTSSQESAVVMLLLVVYLPISQ
jgi:hypothetical protein